MRLAVLLALAAAAFGAAGPAAAGVCVHPTSVHHVCVTGGRVCVGSTRPPDLCVPTSVDTTG